MIMNYFRTGDMARFFNVTPDTVRYYDKEGLVKPSLVKDNNYRYYSLNEALNFGNITMLRELGIPISSIKKSLAYSDVEEVLAMNHTHRGDVTREIAKLRQKLEYLDIMEERLRYFRDHHNRVILMKDVNLYLCRGMEFSMNESDVTISPSFADESVDDLFWTRTSMISRVRNRTCKRGEHMYCSNVVSSECDRAERIAYEQVLAYNFIGNPFENSEYQTRIDAEIEHFAQTHRLVLTELAYEIFYICLQEQGRYRYFIQHLYPVR